MNPSKARPTGSPGEGVPRFCVEIGLLSKPGIKLFNSRNIQRHVLGISESK